MWKATPVSAQKPSSKEFLSFLNSCSLTQLVTTPTHNLGRILDLFITSSPNAIENIDVREPLSSTNDHNMIEISLSTIYSKHKSKQRYNFYKANYLKINEFFAKTDWSPVFDNTSGNNVNSMYNKFISIFYKCIDSFVPLTNVKHKPRLPSFLKQISNKKKLYYKLSKTIPSAKPTYKYYEKLYT